MSQFAQLSEAEIEERFHVTGSRPVQFLLAGYAEHAEPFTVQFSDGSEHFLTMLLEVRPALGGVILDCSGSPELNKRFLESERNVFVARPGGIHVQFSTCRAKELTYAGAQAFVVPLPKFVIRLQRREYFRIETPRVHPAQFVARQADGKLLSLIGHDVSVSGIGLASPHELSNLSQGQKLGNCRFSLPEDEHDVFVDAIVRHITPQEGRSGTTWRLGLEFENLARSEQNRIQRYIARIEHERCA